MLKNYNKIKKLVYILIAVMAITVIAAIVGVVSLNLGLVIGCVVVIE